MAKKGIFTTGTKVIIALWIALFIFAKVPGKLEGNYFPVFDNFSYSITDSKYDENSSDIYMSFNKLRPECAFRKIDFYLYGEDKDGVDQFVLMRNTYKGLEETRFLGKQEGVGPWVIRNKPENLKNISILIKHRCHVGFETITLIRIRNGEYVDSNSSSISMN